MNKPFRIAVVNSHPIQYFAPLYAYLNRDPSLEITALYCSDSSVRGTVDPGFGRPVAWDVDLLAGYDVKWLGERAKTRTPGGFWSLVCPEVWAAIRDGRFDAVWLHGYAYASYVLAFTAAKWHGIPVLVRTETHLGLTRNSLRRWIRDTVLSFAYRFVDAFLAIGTANREYYRSLGVPESKIFDVPYTVDNDRFIAAASISDVERAEIRCRFGLPMDAPIVIFASKFMPRKHPEDVVRAMRIVQENGVHASLLMVGTGEMEQTLRELCTSLGLKDFAFAGFVNQAELPRVLAASDVFVLPSENEPWGLIVNEAMCAGLPVVVGEQVGCVRDLVEDSVNGTSVAAGDVPDLANALERLLTDGELRTQMGSLSRTKIRQWGYTRCRDGLMRYRDSAQRFRSPLVPCVQDRPPERRIR